MRPELLLAIRGFRSNKASLLIIVVLALGAANFIIFDGHMGGNMDALYETTVTFYVGDVSIRPEGGERSIQDVDSKVKKIEVLPGTNKVSQKLEATAILRNRDEEEEVRLVGVIPSRHAEAINFDDRLIAGSYLGDEDKDALLVSDDLARSVDARLGQAIELEFLDGQRRSYKVKGITRVGNIDVDSKFVFMNYDELNDALGLEDAATHIVVDAKPGYPIPVLKEQIVRQGVDDKVRTAEEESVGVRETLDKIHNIERVMIIVTLMVGALMEFVIFLIHVLSKTREIGVLKAIGTKDSSIMAIYISQGVMYGAIACVLGVLLGYAVSLYFLKNPIFVPSSHVYIRPRMTYFSFVFASVMTMLSAIVASLYPAYRAVKIEIAEAMRLG